MKTTPWNVTRNLKITALAAMTVGMLQASPCTVRDIQQNVIAGSLGYVKSGATSFWDNFFPVDNFFADAFNRNEN